MKTVDVEALRAILADDKVTLAVAKVIKVELLTDFSICRALVKVYPEEYEAVVTVSWPHARAGKGFFTLPEKDDLVLVSFSNKDEGFIVGYLSSSDDLIPKQAKEGHTILLAKAGKTLELASDTKGLLSLGNADNPPTEPLVLGLVLQEMLTTFITHMTTHITKFEAILDGIIAGDLFMSTSPGSPTAPNPTKAPDLIQMKTDIGTLKTDIDTMQTDFLDTAGSNILSQLWFTERGGGD